MNAEYWINELGLEKHPEGGYFKEVYRSSGLIKQESLGESFSGDRNYSTAIYFLLQENEFSAFHKIASDEIWHHYSGGAAEIHILMPDGSYKKELLGTRLSSGERPMVVVPARAYFAVDVLNGCDYVFCGCTVAPGFDFQDFKMPPANELIDEYPYHEELIKLYTRS